MELIYRAQTLSRLPVSTQLYQKPRGLHWRFHAPGEAYGETSPITPYKRSRALNWRFQMAAGIAMF